MEILYNQVPAGPAQPQIQPANIVKNLYSNTARGSRFRKGAIVGAAEKDVKFIGKRGWA